MSIAFFGNIMATLPTSISTTTISAGSSATTSSVTASAVNIRGGTLTYSWTITGTNCTINTPSSSSTTVTGSGVGGTTELFCNIRNSVTGVAYSTPSCVITWTASIPITSVTFQYSNDGTTWTNIPAGGVGITYDSLTYQLRVGSITPAEATYTITTQETATNAGQTANMIIVGSGSYTGTFISPTLQILQRTITATNSNYFEGAFQPDGCFNFQAVAGFNITLGNLINGATGVSLSVLYGTSYDTATLCSVSSNINIEGVVSSQQGSSPYQNRIYNTNGVKTFYTNFNNVPAYFWCVINSFDFSPSYNSNYSSPILSFAGSPAPFYNSCQT